MSLSSLDFLNLGVPSPTPSLGELLRQAKGNVEAWWLSLTTFAVLVLIVSGCTDEGGDTTSNRFPQPQVRQSSGRVLHTTLKAQITTNTLHDAATGQTFVTQGPTYEGRFPGPTLIVHPGDTLNIDLVNNFPANPPSHRGGRFITSNLIRRTSTRMG